MIYFLILEKISPYFQPKLLTELVSTLLLIGFQNQASLTLLYFALKIYYQITN
nr:MAG TPA: hypothetical protein [Caudoviricetes sp.]